MATMKIHVNGSVFKNETFQKKFGELLLRNKLISDDKHAYAWACEMFSHAIGMMIPVTPRSVEMVTRIVNVPVTADELLNMANLSIPEFWMERDCFGRNVNPNRFKGINDMNKCRAVPRYYVQTSYIQTRPSGTFNTICEVLIQTQALTGTISGRDDPLVILTFDAVEDGIIANTLSTELKHAGFNVDISVK